MGNHISWGAVFQVTSIRRAPSVCAHPPSGQSAVTRPRRGAQHRQRAADEGVHPPEAAVHPHYALRQDEVVVPRPHPVAGAFARDGL
eukprot:gene2911-biopygen11662